jgi:hypothetical protein
MFPMMGKASTIQFFIDPSGACSRILVYNHTVNLALVPVAGAMKFPVAASFDIAGRSAQGTVSAVPTNYNEGIRCEAQSFDQVFCGVTDNTLHGVGCYASGSAVQTLADQMLAVSAIDEYSHVSFTWDNTGTTGMSCTSIVVTKASYYTP